MDILALAATMHMEARIEVHFARLCQIGQFRMAGSLFYAVGGALAILQFYGSTCAFWLLVREIIIAICMVDAGVLMGMTSCTSFHTTPGQRICVSLIGMVYFMNQHLLDYYCIAEIPLYVILYALYHVLFIMCYFFAAFVSVAPAAPTDDAEMGRPPAGFPVPATEEDIASITTRTLRSSSDSRHARSSSESTSSSGSRSDEFTVCSICLRSFRDRQRISTLPCLHKYHADCIEPWMKQSNQCPICKQALRYAVPMQAVVAD